MTEDLFFSARWQQKRSLPSLRVDNSTSGKITHYCFGANSGEKPASLRQREVMINTPLHHPLNFLVIGSPPNIKKYGFTPTTNRKIKKNGIPPPR